MSYPATGLIALLRSFVTASAFAGLNGLAEADGEEAPLTHVAPATKPAAEAVRFVPRGDDVPVHREGGAVRQFSAEPGLYVLTLAPANGVGKTSEEQPTLLWYISKPTRHEVEMRVTALPPATTHPARTDREAHVFHLKHGVSVPGIKKLNLATAQDAAGKPVRLAPGVTYEWGVEVLVHPGGEDAADDPSSVVKLQRLDPSEAVSRAVQGGDQTVLAQVYMHEGIWYDALRVLTKVIDAAPNDRLTREMRRNMLLEVGHYVEDEKGVISELQQQGARPDSSKEPPH